SPSDWPSTPHSRIAMRPGVALVSTMSLTAVCAPPPAPPTSVGRSSTSYPPANARSSPVSRSVAAMLARNPTRPKFTPRQGMPVPSHRWSARSMVPSPPSTTTMSGSSSSTTSTPQRAATARRRSGASPMTSARPWLRKAARATATPSRRGERTFDLVCDIGGLVLLHGVRMRREVHKVLAISGRARDTRIAHAEDGPAARGRKPGEILQHPPAHLTVADDAAANIGPAGLELGLHEDERPPRIGGARQHGGQHEAKRDERDVGRDEARAERQRPPVQLSRFCPIDHRDPGI